MNVKTLLWRKDPATARPLWGRDTPLPQDWRLTGTATVMLPTHGPVTAAFMQHDRGEQLPHLGLAGRFVGRLTGRSSEAELLLSEREIFRLAMQHLPRGIESGHHDPAESQPPSSGDADDLVGVVHSK